MTFPRSVVLLLLALAAASQEAAADSVNWTVTVSAKATSEITTNQTQQLTANLSGAGGIRGWTPAANTKNFNITWQLKSGVCQTLSDVLYDVPNTAPYYSIWYTYLGGTLHKLQIFAGNVGEQLLFEDTFDRSCANGYKSMTGSFDMTIVTSVVEMRSAVASGTLVGQLGEAVSASWYAAPQAQGDAALGSYTQSVTWDNPTVTLSVLANSDNVSGTVTGVFPSCVAEAETCDGKDNDCDGFVDENLDSLSCGAGACFNTVAACFSGNPQACAPLAASGEICDGLDNDCDGSTDEELGSVACGVGACAVTVAACASGSPQACAPLQPTAETCGDGIDNDCDALIDEGCTSGANKVCADDPLGVRCEKASQRAARKTSQTVTAASALRLTDGHKHQKKQKKEHKPKKHLAPPGRR